jgi:phage protein D
MSNPQTKPSAQAARLDAARKVVNGICRLAGAGERLAFRLRRGGVDKEAAAAIRMELEETLHQLNIAEGKPSIRPRDLVSTRIWENAHRGDEIRETDCPGEHIGC